MLDIIGRRDFMKVCSQAGVTCALALCPFQARAAEAGQTSSGEKPSPPDPDKLSYCGLVCGPDCKLYKATQENNVEMKRAVYDEWGWKANTGEDFDADKVFCYGCKAPGKPTNANNQRCTVLKCAVDKKLASCIQCKSLRTCDRKFWKDWADLKRHVDALQDAYVAGGNALI
ncbi:MAG: DUF3795 domain-containing protein [Acidobacteriota bacterium]